MKVTLHPADQAACGFFRMEEPARVSGVETELEIAIPIEVMEDPRTRARYQRPTADDADVHVFQRPALEGTLELIPYYQRRGQAVVVDIDDDFTAMHPMHPVKRGPAQDGGSWKNVMRACGLADLVTVTSPALAERYAQHGRCAILPNCVPEAIIDLPRESDGHTVGWGGFPPMHEGDLEVTHGGVGDALRDTDWRFLHIGTWPEVVRERLHLDAIDNEGETSGLTIEDYHRSLGRFDIGIVPLGDTAFNHAKSYLKGIELAARGVPFVASPCAEYQYLHDEEGLGLLAPARARNWRGRIRELMDDSLRGELAEAGIAAVRERHTFEGNGWRWTDAWQEALDNRAAALEHKAAA